MRADDDDWPGYISPIQKLFVLSDFSLAHPGRTVFIQRKLARVQALDTTRRIWAPGPQHRQHQPRSLPKHHGRGHTPGFEPQYQTLRNRPHPPRSLVQTHRRPKLTKRPVTMWSSSLFSSFPVASSALPPLPRPSSTPPGPMSRLCVLYTTKGPTKHAATRRLTHNLVIAAYLPPRGGLPVQLQRYGYRVPVCERVADEHGDELSVGELHNAGQSW